MAKIGSKAAIEIEAGFVTMQAVDRLDRRIATLEGTTRRLRSDVNLLLESNAKQVGSDVDVPIDVQDFEFELIGISTGKRLESSFLFIVGGIDYQLPMDPSGGQPVTLEFGFLKDGVRFGGVTTHNDETHQDSDPPVIVRLPTSTVDSPNDFESHVYTLWMTETTAELTGIATRYGIVVLEIT